MSKPIKLLEEVSMNISNEEKMQREDAKKELFSYQELVTITPPDWMPASAISEWDRLVPIMKKEFPLSETDYALLISYCLSFARLKTAEGEIRKFGTFVTNENTGVKRANPAISVQSQAMRDMKSSASALGMTLEARSRLALNKAKENTAVDPFESLVSNG